MRQTPRPHESAVRVTHWINTAAFVALVISGVAVLMAHPRLYWGETGNVGTTALVTLPIATNVEHSGWGRSLHFLAAWACVLNGAIYTCSGLMSGHFRRHLLPSQPPTTDTTGTYHRPQQITYLAVVFLVLPLMIATGLAMSPAVMAALPIVNLFGGHQSARTIHGFVAAGLVLFLLVHVIMVWRSGFVAGMRRMLLG